MKCFSSAFLICFLQELLWQNALDDIQREIGNKLDKSELLPLRDFINSKLKLLQDRLKDLSKLKKEAEAAGAKSKYLKYAELNRNSAIVESFNLF